MLTIAVLSILLTAPLGAAGISLSGPFLLKKKKPEKLDEEEGGGGEESEGEGGGGGEGKIALPTDMATDNESSRTGVIPSSLGERGDGDGHILKELEGSPKLHGTLEAAWDNEPLTAGLNPSQTTASLHETGV